MVAIVAIIGVVSLLNEKNSMPNTIILSSGMANPEDLTGQSSFSCYLDQVRAGNNNLTEIKCICGYGC